MTLSSLPNNDSNRSSVQQENSSMQQTNFAEVIRALTPIFIAGIGGVIGIVILLTDPENTAGFGLASSAIAGAAGLAQPNKDLKDK